MKSYKQWLSYNLHTVTHPPTDVFIARLAKIVTHLFVAIFELILFLALCTVWFMLLILAPISIPLLAWGDYLQQRKEG